MLKKQQNVTLITLNSEIYGLRPTCEPDETTYIAKIPINTHIMDRLAD